MKPSDSALLQAWTEHRDAQAFEQIVHRYAGLVYSAAYRVVGSAADAEDVAQECFLALARTEGAGPQSLAAWLHTVATRQALKRVRGDRARERRERARPDTHSTPHEPEWNDLKAYVDQAIEELPEELRYAITAHFLLQRTHRSIAEELGLTRQAVSHRVARGVAELRHTLQRRGIAAPAAVLASSLAAHAQAAVPSTLAASLGKRALARTPGVSSPASIPSMSGLQWGALALTAMLVAGAALTVLMQRETRPAVVDQLSTPAPGQDPTRPPTQSEAPSLDAESLPAPTEPAPEEVAVEAATHEGIVSGRVYDLNTGLAVPEATVVAEYSGRSRAPSGTMVTSTHAQQAITDAMGHFEIGRLRSEVYALRVYAELQDIVFDSIDADLRANGEVRGIQLGVTLEEPDQAKIEGVVTRGEEYVAQQNIRLAYETVPSANADHTLRSASSSTGTGHDGSYAFRVLPLGRVMLTMSHHPGFLRMSQFVDLAPGDEYWVDFDLPTDDGGGIAGWIEPPQGGRVMHAYTDNRDGVSVRWTTATTPQGFYSYSGLPAGAFEVTVEPGDIQPNVLEYELDGRPMRSLQPRSETIRIANGVWTNLRIPFVPTPIETAGSPQPPRRFYASHAEAVANPIGEITLDDSFGSGVVTVEAGKTARLNIRLDAE